MGLSPPQAAAVRVAPRVADFPCDCQSFEASSKDVQDVVTHRWEGAHEVWLHRVAAGRQAVLAVVQGVPRRGEPPDGFPAATSKLQSSEERVFAEDGDASGARLPTLVTVTLSARSSAR